MLARLRSLWRNLRYRDRVDHDLDTEVRAVFDILVDEKIAQGLSPQQARRAATLELGRVDAIKQVVREERAGSSLEAIGKDIRYGARMLRANPGFSFVVILSLAAGIGANSAIFSIANAMLLKTVPVPQPEHLYVVRVESRLPANHRVSYPIFEQLRAGFPTPTGLAGISRVARMRLGGTGGDPQSAAVQLVTGEFFDVLRVTPQLGRVLRPDDNRTLSGHPVTVISDSFWRRQFNAAADAIGRDIVFNGAHFTVVGVMKPGFSGVWLESPVDAWIPAMMQSDAKYSQNFSASGADAQKPWVPQRGLSWLDVVTRADRADGPESVALNAVFRPMLLEQVASIDDAQQRALTLDRRLVLEPFGAGFSNVREQFRAPLYALLGMVALLLLIACANTANLLLARATSRQREMAVRLSIGASRGRIISQLLIESVLLGVIAAAVGLAIAPLISEALVRMTIGVDTGPLPFSVGIDARVIAFTVTITLMTSFLFGFAPAWRATDLTLSAALRSSGRGTHRGARLSLAKVLVVAQVALSLSLAVGAGLFARSFNRLVSQPLGVDESVISIAINPSLNYSMPELPALYQRLLDRVEAIPGVQSATVAMCSVLNGCRSNSDGVAFSGYTSQPDEQVVVQINRVGRKYFSTLGMPIVAGRDFDAREVGGDAKVVIVNEALVRKYFKGRDPLGERFGYDTPDLEIIGVVRDAHVNTVREAPLPMVFHPFDATPSFVGSMQIRTAGDPGTMGAVVRRVVTEQEPRLTAGPPATLGTLAASTLRQERLIARLTIIVGLLALALASLGLYGLMAYAVKQRTAELGVRFALGAPRGRVLWMVLRESMLLVAIGLAIGVPAVLAVSRLIAPMLFEVSPNDPTVVSIAIAVLFVVGAWSGYLPAWRASRIDPLVALRQE
jgi:predicted permease